MAVTSDTNIRMELPSAFKRISTTCYKTRSSLDLQKSSPPSASSIVPEPTVSANYSRGGKPIKVTLIHNPSAGDDAQASGERIVQLIRAAGHKVNYRSSKDRKWKKALKKTCDIVAVAGGDGTVGKVARRLIGSRTPLAILPMGTANNIANTLGITGRSLQQLIKGWNTARCINFDAGVAKGPWGSRCFIEGFGTGLFAEVMYQLKGEKNNGLPSSGKSSEVINSVLAVLKKQLQGYRSIKMTVRLDGQDVSGDYVLLEALNIGHIGPNLDLVSRVDINDGFFDVVFVTKRERAKLSRYLTDRISRKRSRLKLTTRRGRHLQIEWESSPVHIDDTPWPEDEEGIPVRSTAIDVKIQPGALVFLVPKTRRRVDK